VSFGYVIDFACPAKDALGGTLAAATRLGEGARLVPAQSGCDACDIADGCIGVVAAPLAAEVEQWLMERLPGELESIAGEVIKQAVAAGFEGKRARELRRTGKLGGPRALERSWGGFFRKFTLTSDQLIEQMFCAGDLEPPQSLAILVELSALAVDGRVPTGLDEGAGLSELAEDVPSRRRRTQCTLTITPSDPPALAELKGFLRALHAAFCLDRNVLVFAD
jgi:hypothetical protein